MFVARTGIRTRGLKDGQSGLTALLAPKRKKKEDDYGFICWVPCMLYPCLGGLIGLVILLGGTAMCSTGYYSKYFSSQEANNGTHVITTIDSSKQFHIHNLTFLGPVIMGCGCFGMMIACVVICEQRDKDIKVKVEEAKRKKMQKGNKKNAFYNSVLERLKRSKVMQKIGNEEEGEDCDTEKIVQENDKKKTSGKKTIQENIEKLTECNENQSEKEKSKLSKFVPPCILQSESETSENQYSHISSALKKIPMDLFTVNMEVKGSNMNSLLPIRINQPSNKLGINNSRGELAAIVKYPSAACISDIIIADNSRSIAEKILEENYKLRKTKSEKDLQFQESHSLHCDADNQNKPSQCDIKSNMMAGVCSNKEICDDVILAIDVPKSSLTTDFRSIYQKMNKPADLPENKLCGEIIKIIPSEYLNSRLETVKHDIPQRLQNIEYPEKYTDSNTPDSKGHSTSSQLTAVYSNNKSTKRAEGGNTLGPDRDLGGSNAEGDNTLGPDRDLGGSNAEHVLGHNSTHITVQPVDADISAVCCDIRETHGDKCDTRSCSDNINDTTTGGHHVLCQASVHRIGKSQGQNVAGEQGSNLNHNCIQSAEQHSNDDKYIPIPDNSHSSTAQAPVSYDLGRAGDNEAVVDTCSVIALTASLARGNAAGMDLHKEKTVH